MRRRAFIAAGLSAGVLAAGFTLYRNTPAIPKRPKADENTAKGWISHKEGRYQLLLPRIEMGQNIATGLKQIACDELGVSWDDVDLKMQDTLIMEPVRMTAGSESIRDYALPLAQACASLREAVARGEDGGEISVTPRPLSQLRAFTGKGRYVGRSVELVQGEDIVRGMPVFAADIMLPEMVYGRVLRAPTSTEIASKPISWNGDAAKAVPGFISIVADDRLYQGDSLGIGIIATTPGTLDGIADALDVQWEVDGGFEQTDIDDAVDVDRRLAKGDLTHEVRDDGIDADAAWDVDFRFDIPAAAHVPIEPHCAVARINRQGGAVKGTRVE